MATIEIKGLQGVINRLRALGKDLDTVVDNSLHKSAYHVKRQTENNIEAVGAVDTGRLRNSIVVEKVDKCRYAVGTNVEYAPYVEFGTGSLGDPIVAHNTSDIGKNGRHFVPHAPKPFLRPAFEAKRQEIKDDLAHDILKAARGGDNR
jgi:HK97 gp10 family phage protein